MDYKNMRAVDLKALAKERGLRGYSRLKKAELIAFLREPRTRHPPTWEPGPRPPSRPIPAPRPRAPSKFFGGVSGSEDRGGGDNSIQVINFGRVGDKNFKEWRQKIGGWKGG